MFDDVDVNGGIFEYQTMNMPLITNVERDVPNNVSSSDTHQILNYNPCFFVVSVTHSSGAKTHDSPTCKGNNSNVNTTSSGVKHLIHPHSRELTMMQKLSSSRAKHLISPHSKELTVVEIFLKRNHK